MELCGEIYEYRLFPLLDLQYPGSCFVYNMRDVSCWVGLRTYHHKGKFARTHLGRTRRRYDYLSLTLEDLLQHWQEAWRRHDLDLKCSSTRRINFFAFNIRVLSEQATLCRFHSRRGY